MGQIILKGLDESIHITNTDARRLQDDWIGGKLGDVVKAGGMVFEPKQIKTIKIDMEVVRQTDNTKDMKEVKDSWKNWDNKPDEDKILWWFKSIFMTHWTLRDKQGIDYEDFKRRVGNKKMKEIYIWVKDWYAKPHDARWPPYEEYSHFLPPALGNDIEGWRHISEVHI